MKVEGRNKVEEPKKKFPTIMVYDVETEHKVDDIRNDIISKNFDYLKEEEMKELKDKITLKYQIKTRENRSNWIIQLPGRYASNLIEKGKVYVQWRRYRVREFKNIIRCYKCHAFGHMAKFCSLPDQFCETCGSKEHLKKDCTDKDKPQCINCMRAKRKDIRHYIKSGMCPELKRQIDLYDNKIKWD